MARKPLTDRKMKSLKPAEHGKRYEVADPVVTGLIVRVGSSGRPVFYLVARYRGAKHPTRRKLGEYGILTLAQAREKAWRWIDLNRRGVDPKVEEERTRREELAKQRTSFASVAEEFIKRRVASQRRAKETARDIRHELVSRWGTRPITEITRADVIEMVEEIADRPGVYYAHLILGHLRNLFNWAIERDIYGLEGSPCDRLRPEKLIGAKKPRQRVLTFPEIAALWHAAEKLEYPFGPLYRLLLLTGARRSEVAGMRWSEIDLDKRTWSVPPERFKSGSTHTVPLTADAISILKALPRLPGDHVFSFTLGSTPVVSFGAVKAKLDAMMAPASPWVTHDVRRTVRTGLASLNVPDTVAEMVIGHGRKGLQRVYDLHTYEPEMREALEKWAAKLREERNVHNRPSQ
jgi:integrase